jgi:hypothetical protein
LSLEPVRVVTAALGVRRRVTTFGLKQPNAAATTSPGTWPMQADRLVK